MKKPVFFCGLALAHCALPAMALSGKAVFEQTCINCHGKGVLGAPKFGNRDDWSPRIAKGQKTLHEHADYGFNSMPPHGGNDELTDNDVHAAVDYMVEQAGGYTAEEAKK